MKIGIYSDSWSLAEMWNSDRVDPDFDFKKWLDGRDAGAVYFETAKAKLLESKAFGDNLEITPIKNANEAAAETGIYGLCYGGVLVLDVPDGGETEAQRGAIDAANVEAQAAVWSQFGEPFCVEEEEEVNHAE